VTEIVAMQSTDGGKTWTKPQVVLTAHGKADYPQILSVKTKVYVAIHTLDGGLLMTPFNE
jgi:Neuraminidase (sialidase)